MSDQNPEDPAKPPDEVPSSFLATLGFRRRKRKPEPKKEEQPVATEEKMPILEILSSFITLFLSVSTIHGFAHLTAEKRHPIEILIWFSLMGAGVYGACILSSATWTRYQENPTVVSMERDRFAWNTSFPAATICPTARINDELLNIYLEKSPVKNKTALTIFLKSLAGATYTNFDKVVPFDEVRSEDYMKILLQLQFEFTPSVSNSGTHGYKYYLDKTITEMGICYSFNSNLAAYNSPSYWENNHWKLLPENRTFYVHPLDGEVLANVVNMTTAFDFYLHGPFEVVDVASKGVYSPNGHFLQVYLSGLTIFTTDSARALGVSQRKCRFYDESDLPHSPVYSYVLCRMECRATLSKRLCNCIPHFYRHLDGERVCDVAGLHCLAQYSERLVTLKRECSCYPNCNEVNYVIEDLDTREWFLGSNLQWGLKEYPRMRLRRDVIFGFTDVLVYVGGMAGLFLGCSVLSFVEVFYFFTIRLFWYVTKYGKDTREIYNAVH